MKKKKWIWILAVVVLVIVVVVTRCGGETFETIVSTQKTQTGTIESTITATGEIQPVNKVTVGTQVSGIVEHLYVDYNSEVTRGQLLAELDKSTLQEQVKQSQANLSTARSGLQLAQRAFDRVKNLYDKKAATQEEYDQAENTLQQTRNQMVTAQSNYDNAMTNLKYAEIYSPISGVVINKEVEEGQTVAASFSTPTLFTIANDLTQMQVEADVDEADIGMVRVGQPVRFTVDAFPRDTFQGTVKQIRLEPTVTNNVVTYTVIIDAPNRDNKLYPGMTANVNIIVQSEEGLLIPYEALYLQLEANQIEWLKQAGYSLDQPTKKPASDGPKAMPQPTGEKGSPIWVVNDKQLRPVFIEKGLDDGANMIVRSGLNEGDEVILSVERVKKNSGENSDNPFMMGPPKQKKR